MASDIRKQKPKWSDEFTGAVNTFVNTFMTAFPNLDSNDTLNILINRFIAESITATNENEITHTTDAFSKIAKTLDNIGTKLNYKALNNAAKYIKIAVESGKKEVMGNNIKLASRLLTNATVEDIIQAATQLEKPARTLSKSTSAQSLLGTGTRTTTSRSPTLTPSPTTTIIHPPSAPTKRASKPPSPPFNQPIAPMPSRGSSGLGLGIIATEQETPWEELRLSGSPATPHPKAQHKSKLDTEIKDAEARLASTNANLTTLAAERDSINRDLAAVRARLNSANEHLDATNTRLRKTETELGIAKKDYEAVKVKPWWKQRAALYGAGTVGLAGLTDYAAHRFLGKSPLSHMYSTTTAAAAAAPPTLPPPQPPVIPLVTETPLPEVGFWSRMFGAVKDLPSSALNIASNNPWLTATGATLGAAGLAAYLYRHKQPILKHRPVQHTASPRRRQQASSSSSSHKTPHKASPTKHKTPRRV
jgi:hypothetical protein